MNKKITFMCGAKDLHSMDKFDNTGKIVGFENITLLTDTLKGEGQMTLIKPNYSVKKLIIIDSFTFKRKTGFGNKWRNFIKFAILPLQAIKLRMYYNKNKNQIFHAVPMYYMLLCSLAGIRYVGTPQGSEILVRSRKSKVYRFFARRAIKNAEKVIVDSIAMQEQILKLFKITPFIFKNGFNTDLALRDNFKEQRENIISARIVASLYRTLDIINARNRFLPDIKINLIYPNSEGLYLKKVNSALNNDDIILGRLNREELYLEFKKTLLVVSIPISDSSPRSVYEAIFCGAAVAICDNRYFEKLPKCMQERIILVDLNNVDWLKFAYQKAIDIVKKQYFPSKEAIEMCNDLINIHKIVNEIYITY